MKKRCVALIPARSGSKRIRNKNIQLLAGYPLIAYTISTAIKSEIFSRIIVSTDNDKISKIAQYYGAEVPFLRPAEYAQDASPDIEWLKYTLQKLELNKQSIEFFSILRPSSPFRSVSMLEKAWELFLSDKDADSLRAVERCLQHPAKMWIVNGNRMNPVIKNPESSGIEWYSKPIQELPKVYVQNSSLEIAKCEIPLMTLSIAGTKIIPFITDKLEGYDINTEKDWIYAEYLIKKGLVILPHVDNKPYLG